jgi:hypothetical protein
MTGEQHVPESLVDVRGPRFAAWVTSVVLALVLLTSSGWLLGAQFLVFVVGAVFGIRRAPYGVLFARLVRPRLGPPSELEAEPPLRFAQAVGATFAAVGTLGFLVGSPAVGLAATALALAAAFLNAAFGICLGCEMYLLFRRATARSDAQPIVRSGETVGSPTRRGAQV